MPKSMREALQEESTDRYQKNAARAVRNSTRQSASLAATSRLIGGLKKYRSRVVRKAKKMFDKGLEYDSRYLIALVSIPALLWCYFFFNYHPIIHLFELDKTESDNNLFIDCIVFGTSVALVAGAISISSARRNAHEKGGGWFWHIVTILFFCASVLASLSLQFALLKTDTAVFNASDWTAIGFKVLVIFAIEAVVLYGDHAFFYGLAWLRTWIILVGIGFVLILARWRQGRLNAAIGSSVGQLGNLADNYQTEHDEPILTPPTPKQAREGYREVMGYEVIPEPAPPPAAPTPTEVNQTRTEQTETPPAPAQTPPAEDPHQPAPEAPLDPDEVARENDRLRQELEARARRDESEVRPE